VIEKIDQTEFEGFEYVNPLLMSLEDCVWRHDLAHHLDDVLVMSDHEMRAEEDGSGRGILHHMFCLPLH